MKTSCRWALVAAGWIAAVAFFIEPLSAASHKTTHHKAGAAQTGVASVYSHKFAGKKTASGKPFKPNRLTAASRKLPLNSKAKVTNLKTGQSTKVTITDRGPYKKGRVIDLSPKAAKEIGVTKKEGVAPVVVKPIAPPPQPDAQEAVAATPE
jgi:rare lipoprotein A